MWRLLFSFFLLLFSTALFAQDAEYVEKNIKTDFGASGDGSRNDFEAFKEAAAFFNERQGRGTLIIPPGTYIVGKQLDYGVLLPIAYRPLADGALMNPYYKLGLPVLLISGCKNFTIKGENGAVLKFQNDMLLGGFFPDGKPMPLKDKKGNTLVPEANSITTIGDGLYIENCDSITISDLEIDGNSTNQTIGGNISSDGWQWGQSGIVMVEVRNCRLENLNVHHFVVDGLQIRNTTTKDIDRIDGQSIIMNKCSFDYNGRQGFSWTGGAGLKAISCTFNHTGRAYNNSLKKPLSTAPGAGLDIEPESDPNINTFRIVKDGVFKNCTFENNSGAGMVADIYNKEEYRIAQDVSFEDCTFWGTTYWSVWVSHPGFTFTNCRIYGSAVHSFDSDKPGKETKFISCFFEDKPYINDKGKRMPPYGNYLVEIADGIRTTFRDCTFTSHGKYYHYLVASKPNDDKSKFIVHNCRFLNVSGTDKPKNSIAEGVLFTGNNKYVDAPASR